MASTTHSVTGNGNYPSDDGVEINRPVTISITDPGAATVKIQVKADADWQDVPDSSFTDATVKNLDIHGANWFYRQNSPQTIRFNVASYDAPFKIVVM